MSDDEDVDPAPAVSVREELAALRPAPLECGDDVEGVRVDHGLDATLSSLCRIVECHDVVSSQGYVRAAHRRKAEGVVVLCVHLASDPEEASVEEAHRAGEDALTPEIFLCQAAVRVRPQAPESDGELEHPIELLAVAASAPGVVVEVLPPPRRVRPDCLQVPQRVGTDPDVTPGGRDGERSDSLELAHVSNRGPVFASILEAASSPAARDPRLRTITAAKTRHCTGAGTPPRCNAKPRSVGAQLDTKDAAAAIVSPPSAGYEVVLAAEALAPVPVPACSAAQSSA